MATLALSQQRMRNGNPASVRAAWHPQGRTGTRGLGGGGPTAVGAKHGAPCYADGTGFVTGPPGGRTAFGVKARGIPHNIGLHQ